MSFLYKVPHLKPGVDVLFYSLVQIVDICNTDISLNYKLLKVFVPFFTTLVYT